MQTFKKFFLLPTIITILLLAVVLNYAGPLALVSAIILIILEVTLSFDNAVVNAKVLEKMDEVWRRRFINWGIWFAVFGTRIILPIIIVAIVAGISPLAVLSLAINDTTQYSKMLDEAHYSIGAFGGIFLLLVAMKYFIDDTKEIHWIRRIEKRLKKFSSIESVEIVFALLILLIIGYSVPAHIGEILVSGIIGIILFVLMQGITNKMGSGLETTVNTGLWLFIYLNILDTAFSLDGVIGAFAISSSLLVISVGLGIGAYFVRSFTVMLVEKKSLAELVYLEHGAHWAVAGLGLCMLLGLVYHIPEVVIGLIGLLFVLAAYFSSIRSMNKEILNS